LTNYGKKFVFGFTAQYSFSGGGHIGISLMAHFDTNVSITTHTSTNPLNFSFYMKEGDSLQYTLPLSLRMQGKQNKGIEVSSTMDISVICLDYYSSYGDGYLALPTHALGITYIVASYQPYNSYSRADIGIVSAHDGNNILIQLNGQSTIKYEGIWYNHGNPLQVPLDKLQSIQLTSSSDLSGTIIYASKPISLVSSVDRAISDGSGRIDRLESFLLPVTQWGKQYILTTVGATSKKQGDVFRIFAHENNTIIESAYWTKVLLSRTYVELILKESLASFVNCNKPCQVIQYIKGEVIGGKNADTSMIVLPSIKQFLPYYRIVPSYTSNFYSSVTITIEDSYTNGLYINGLKIDNLNWIKITGTRYVWTVVSTPGTKIGTFYHSSPEVTFGLLVFGWNNDVSYAYPGGFAFEHYNTGKYSHAKTLLNKLLFTIAT
jgi:hypothetical protein